ncbi:MULTISPECIES: response regulator transcription factor [Streptomyces]|uniref:response regulator transcription factor n=1 Tax=Streptomyces TaxID=1883 RepID=UPI000FDBD767|nr:MULTISPECIES: response regulator transcription factor [unclassified Streptomyces]MCW1097381.1 response regulator transcription factor [Streptomyces sp. RS2]
MKLLVVEPNERVSVALGAALEEQGLEAVSASTGAAALSLLDRTRPDAVLLDLALTDCDSFWLCGAIRATGSVPILVTSARDDHQSCVRALDLGADDYLVKPYNLAELLARTRAVVRRNGPAGPSVSEGASRPDPTADTAEETLEDTAEEPLPDLLLAGRVRVDLRERAVLVDGAPTELPDEEFDILAALARRPGEALSADRIVEEIVRAQRVSLRATVPARLAALRDRLAPARLVDSPEDGLYSIRQAQPFA